MIDDWDRCEWMNVSFGTGSPRLSQTKPVSHRMVVCVCVCVNRFVVFLCICMYGCFEGAETRA